ncbi:MAG: RnfABCDGE type electron transport complex subunit D [Clostridia bacterium]|nr:RnfABCDGE type electron transport complex subunit D [Clostridia bacterium]
MENLIVSSSPHIHSRATTRNIMRDVVIALLPATVAAIVLFGFKAALMIAVCVASAILSEFFFSLIAKKKQTIGDLSAVVTGLLLALNLSTKVELWQCMLGSMFAIIIVKCVFGGLGKNFANPAITGRIFLVIAFGAVAGGAHTVFTPEISAGATPLEIIKSGSGTLPSLFNMLIGNRGGAIGETCAIALIIGFVYLLCRKVISWHIPVVFVGTVFVLSLIVKQDLTIALYEVLGGGLLIGAIFMATDYVTSPMGRLAKVIFAFGCGVITVLIRFWGSYPEGVSFAILFMNILSPYIEKIHIIKPLGGIKNVKK